MTAVYDVYRTAGVTGKATLLEAGVSRERLNELRREHGDDVLLWRGAEVKQGTQTLMSCSTCGRGWFLAEEEKSFCESKGYPYPTRCKACRRARREAKLNQNQEDKE